MKSILGISAFYHDSAASILIDGEIIAAAQEERFTRKKHDPSYPNNAVEFVLDHAKLKLHQIDQIVFFEKPFLKFERLLETYVAFAPKGFTSFSKAMPLWIKEKLFQKNLLFNKLKEHDKNYKSDENIFFSDHHLSHAASAFFPSPFEEAVVLTADGVGEWATTTVAVGKGNKLDIKKEIHFPHSLGLLYSAFTYYTGFKVNSGEYKLMGLAPYGNPNYEDKIRELIDIKEDGTFRLNQKYFNYATGLTMTNDHFHNLFGQKPRDPKNEKLTQFHMDIAASIQKVTEDIIIKMSEMIKKNYNVDNLCLAGGVALNCVCNGILQKRGIFKNIWVQPAAGDAGGSLGAALSYIYIEKKRVRKFNNLSIDSMKGSLLGPQIKSDEIEKNLVRLGAKFLRVERIELNKIVAKKISEGKLFGWFQDRMEFGPRALGNRSIIADPRDPTMKKKLNMSIKFREGFRPFAPAILEEKVFDWFDFNTKSPYMQFVAKVKRNKQSIPAVTHVDNSARLQTVSKETNPKFYHLIEEFYKITKVPILINTSFNINNEPIVNSIEDAYKCFLTTELDFLVCGEYLIDKKDQFSNLIKNV